MKMDEIYAGDQYKILHVIVPAGGAIPEHFATSDAFVIVQRGAAELEFASSKLILQPGISFLIPARKPHKLRATAEFEAHIVIGAEAGIEMAGRLAAAGKAEA
jgi:quercetin dioxygenase-like cupin family protein